MQNYVIFFRQANVGVKIKKKESILVL